MLEATLRWRGGTEASPEFQSLFTDDEQVGHRLRPNAEARYTTPEFSTDLKINAQGVRDDQDIGPKPPNERRVVVLGDSLVLSVQVPLAETFGKRLEARLNAAGASDHWRVINAGIQGYGPVEEWLFYEHVASQFQPDVVLVVAFVGNDAIEAFDRESWIDADRPPELTAKDRARTRLVRFVRASMVLQYVRLRWDLLRARFASPGGPRTAAGELRRRSAARGDARTRGDATVGTISIAKKAAADGARTGLVLMPARFQTDDEDYGHLAETVRAAGGVLVRDSSSERFATALAPLGLPMIDLQPVLAAQPDRVGLFFQRNVHLTARGHEVVARRARRFPEDQRVDLTRADGLQFPAVRRVLPRRLRAVPRAAAPGAELAARSRASYYFYAAWDWRFLCCSSASTRRRLRVRALSRPDAESPRRRRAGARR